MFRYVIPLLLLATPAAAEEEQSAQAPPATAEQTTDPALEAHDSPAGLHLNDGELWQMDEHTRTVFADIAATVAETRVETVDDASAAAEELRGHLQTLVAGCTMEGPAHDQLHIFLGAWVPALARFRDAPDVDAARRELEALRRLLGEYQRHFE